MSYDLDVYSVARPSLAAILRKQGGWQRRNSSFVYPDHDWQVIVYEPLLVEEEDLSPAVLKALPGVSFLTRLTLQGIAPQEAYRLVDSVAEEIAKAAHGVLVDQQTGLVHTPRGVVRYVVKKGRDGALLNLHWWFTDAAAFRKKGLEDFLTLAETTLPEVLPRRYGTVEPPQYKYEVQGRKHFVSLMRQEDFDLVWYPYDPVAYVTVGVSSRVGPARIGYRFAHLQVTVKERVLQQPGWAEQLKRFWVSVSEIAKAFYAEIRSPPGFINGCWWNGIPTTYGWAILIGKPYISLWPRFSRGATKTKSNQCFAENLTRRISLAKLLGPVPAKLAQPPATEEKKVLDTKTATEEEITAYFAPVRTRYPKTWPFKKPIQD